ncbi:MFS transporter [Picosynechococcus sp. NKBG042902]|uniref:MFS transporter n=1 Tax=Picosynechococcus sp. NKBG042902 TaxID=490193 RepID=UPI0004AA9311|nr:MFS transporter [Picosynechococcus sp. NKBG042902]
MAYLRPAELTAKNLTTLWLLKGLESAWFPIPVIVLFYESQGLSIAQAIALKAILSAAIFVGEIPSGYFADQFGRKNSLVLGASLWLVGWLIYCTQGSFSWFAWAEILAGLGGSLISGADSAIAYDSLLSLGRTEKYAAWEGKGVAIMGITEAICGLGGAWVAQWDLRYPFYLQTLCIGAYLALALTLREPPQQHSEKTPGWRTLLPQIRAIFQERRSLRWLLLFSASLSCGSFLVVWVSQEYLVERGLDVTQLGWAWLLFHGAMALISWRIHTLVRWFSYRRLFALLPGCMAIAYIAMGLIENLWGILLIVVIYLVRGCNTPLVLSYLNERIPSNLRATLISLNSFAFRLLFIGLAAIANGATWLWGLNGSLMVAGIVVGVTALYGYLKLRPAL